MARRSDHTREELRDVILGAARGIVRKDGFAGLSARRIASEVGYAPGTIYNVFGSMDDLYLHINGVTLDRLYEALCAPVRGGEPVRGLKDMAALYRNFARTNRAYWLMLFTYVLPEGSSLPPWYQEKIERLFEPLEDLLKPFYTARQSRQRKMAARVLWASIHGLCFLEETGKIPLPGHEDAMPDMADYLIDRFVSGLRASSGH